MITLFTGSPGAGKTVSLVDFLSKLDGGRPIYSDGLEGLTLPHTPVDSNNWHTELPDGAILVIDEAQRVWRPRGSGAKVPDSVAALETHRHRGIDVFLTTQAPALIDSNVRNLVGRHVHIRDTGIMGRWWYEWPEVSTGMVWKTCINKKRLTLPKKAFDLYTSSSLHIKPVRGVPRLLIVVIALLLCAVALVYGVYRMLHRFTAPAPVVTAPVSIDGVSQSTAPRPVAAPDESKDFKPRVPGRPWTAPAYDHLRKVVSMPIITGAICLGDACKCYHESQVVLDVSPAACASWASEPSFNPYVADPAPLAPAVPGQNQAKPVQTASVS